MFWTPEQVLMFSCTAFFTKQCSAASMCILWMTPPHLLCEWTSVCKQSLTCSLSCSVVYSHLGRSALGPSVFLYWISQVKGTRVTVQLYLSALMHHPCSVAGLGMDGTVPSVSFCWHLLPELNPAKQHRRVSALSPTWLMVRGFGFRLSALYLQKLIPSTMLWI